MKKFNKIAIIICFGLLFLLIFKNNPHVLGFITNIFFLYLAWKFISRIFFKGSKREYEILRKKRNLILEEEIKQKMKMNNGEKFVAVSFIDENDVAKHFLASTSSGQKVKVSVVEDGFKSLFVEGWK